MTKLWLVEGFCEKDQYHCLMPVEYEGIEEDGVIHKYKKSKMACRHALASACEKEQTCPFWKDAPEELDKNAKWYE